MRDVGDAGDGQARGGCDVGVGEACLHGGANRPVAGLPRLPLGPGGSGVDRNGVLDGLHFPPLVLGGRSEVPRQRSLK